MLSAHELGRLVDLAQERSHRAELRLRHQITLVDAQQVRKLDLVAQQVRDGALVVFGRLPASSDERVHRTELFED